MAKTASTPSDEPEVPAGTRTSSRRRSAASAAPVAAEKPAAAKRRRTDAGAVLTSENVVAMTTGRSTRRASSVTAPAPEVSPAAKKSPRNKATEPSPKKAQTKKSPTSRATRRSPGPTSPSSEDAPPPPPRLTPHPIADETDEDEDEDATVPIPSMNLGGVNQSGGGGVALVSNPVASPLREIQGGVRALPGDVDADLVNSYESVNLVRSDLIREFEARGEALIALRRDNEAANEALSLAEEAAARSAGECARWKAAKDEMERQRRAHAQEKASIAAEHDAALESAARQYAELEATLAKISAERNKSETKNAELEAAMTAKEASVLEQRAVAGTHDASTTAKLRARIAELEADVGTLGADLREAELKAASAESVRLDLERRVAQSRDAIGEMEAAVSRAERTAHETRAAAAQAMAEAASNAGAAAGVKERVRELELSLNAMRDAAKRDAELVKRAKGLETRAGLAVEAEERAKGLEARATRAEARASEAETASRANASQLAEREAWRAAVARVPGCATPGDVADRVVRLERELAQAIAKDGEMAARCAATASELCTERSRVGEMEAELVTARAKLADAAAVSARASNRAELLARERDGLNRVIASYETELANNRGANNNTGNTGAGGSDVRPGSIAPTGFHRSPDDVRAEEATKAIAALTARIGELETELAAAAAARAGDVDARAAALKAAHELRVEVGELRRANEGAAREIAALEARVGRGEYDASTTKILHFKDNPAAIANEAKAEKELAVVRAECEALRETVARMVAEHEQQQQMHMAMVGASLTPGSEHPMPPPVTPGMGMPPPLVPPPTHIMATPAPTVYNRALGTMQTPGPSVAEAEITVLKRRVAELEKREQRYMTVFKQKISTFREACYLIFGFKVDMGEDRGTGQPTFTLRSMFASRDDQAMVFRVNPPKVGATGNETGGTVELLPAPYTSTDEMRRMIDMYVGRWSSVPGFVANLTMELFNKQTAA